jgi:hypothetical protein
MEVLLITPGQRLDHADGAQRGGRPSTFGSFATFAALRRGEPINISAARRLECGAFLLPSPPKPRKPKPLTEFAVVRRHGSTNSLADNATQKRQAKGWHETIQTMVEGARS